MKRNEITGRRRMIKRKRREKKPKSKQAAMIFILFVFLFLVRKIYAIQKRSLQQQQQQNRIENVLQKKKKKCWTTTFEFECEFKWKCEVYGVIWTHSLKIFKSHNHRQLIYVDACTCDAIGANAQAHKWMRNGLFLFLLIPWRCGLGLCNGID